MSSAKFDELIKKVRGQNNTYHSFDLQSFLLLSLLAALLVFYLLLKFFTKHPSSSPHSPLPSPPPLLFPRIIPTNPIHSPLHFHVHFPPLQPFPFISLIFFFISFPISILPQKTKHHDKDERFMATQDMITELKAGASLDPLLERRVCEAVLNQLDDKNADVQSVAIKCIGVLTEVVQEAQICEIVEGLVHHLLTNKVDGLTDIYSIGLSCVVKGVPSTMGATLAQRLAPRLLDGITTDRSESQEIRSECLEVFKQLIVRFGGECGKDHENMMGTLLTQIGNEKSVVQKRATAALGVLAPYLADNLLTRLATTLLQRIETPGQDSDKEQEQIRVYIQAIGRISRTVGHRLGHSIDRIIPLFLRFLGDPNDDDER